MQTSRLILILGVWVAILPYLGFPHYWKDILTVLSGFVMILLAYTLYRKDKRVAIPKVKVFENFSENNFQASTSETEIN